MKRADLIITRTLVLFMASVGLLLLGGGAFLLSLGGSAYYVISGLAVILSAILLWRRDMRAAWLYAIFLLGTLGWSLWEAGADGWALAPRLIGPSIIGLFFAAPWVGNYLSWPRNRTRAPAFFAAASGTASLLVILGVALSSAHFKADVPARSVETVAIPGPFGEWPMYGRTAEGQRFSPLTQITSDNIASLKPAWTYHTGVVTTGGNGTMEATPLMVGDSLYFCTHTNVVISLDPETGKENWRFDPKIDPSLGSFLTKCRGVTFYRAPGAADCPERVFTSTFGAQLIALDAHTGQPCRSFGDKGIVNLKEGIGTIEKGFYQTTSAPVIAAGNIIVNAFVMDDQNTNVPSGVIRAYDATTGRFSWAWDLGKPESNAAPEPGRTYTRGTPNSWAPMSVDETLGLIYAPMGNASPDHWGGLRSPAEEKYSSSVVALDMKTGSVRWSFQTTHHDLWDYDVPSQPSLLDVSVSGKTVPALIQATKRGEIFLLDRRSGAPITTVEEHPVPQRGGVSDDHLAPTQPFSVGLPSVAGAPMKEADMWGLTPLDQLWCRIEFKRLRYDGPATPPGLDRSLAYPSIGGGTNWGGVSIDPSRGILVVNSIYYGTILQLVPRKQTDAELAAATANGLFDYSLPLPQLGTPYGIKLIGFESPLMAPCNKPPYGKLTAIDLRTHQLLWSRPFGSARDTGPFNIPSHIPIPMGMPGFGGSLLTASGLIFIGATQDHTFRAFDINNGELLWSSRLPAGGQATPMTYLSPKSGKQFVLLVAGGHSALRSKLGDEVVAYSLQ